jgi:hypothetical protein
MQYALSGINRIIVVLGQDHPNTQTAMRNLYGFLQKVITENRTAELSDNPMTQKLLADLRQQAE